MTHKTLMSSAGVCEGFGVASEYCGGWAFASDKAGCNGIDPTTEDNNKVTGNTQRLEKRTVETVHAIWPPLVRAMRKFDLHYSIVVRS